MWSWIIIGGFSAIAGAMMLDDNEPPPPPPVQSSPTMVASNDSLESLSGAMVWVGTCGVACSAIGAFTVINLAKLRKGGRR